MPTRFPLRTLVLMALTLVTFAWFYWSTHRPPRHAQVMEVQLSPGGGGSEGDGGRGGGR